MLIGGFQKFSLIDYPDKICAIVFTQGCNFRCGYCHNPETVDPKKFSAPISEEEFFSFLEDRKGRIDAVTITGGEPTLQKDLIEFIKKIKELGYLVKLDSNGSNPEILQEVIDLKIADYVAMDIKASPERYSEVADANVDAGKIKESVDLIIGSGTDYEFRTTVVKNQLREKDFIKIGEMIKGAKLYILQKFVASKANNPDFLKRETYDDEKFEEIKKLMENYILKCEVR